MTESERELDLLVAELGSEVRAMLTQNETLKQQLDAAVADRNRFKEALERILTVSRVALWHGRAEGVAQVGETKRPTECND